jgi:hypothetical protein
VAHARCVNPAKQGVENPQRRRTEKSPFQSSEELEALADRLGPRLGPMVLFAATTGMPPGAALAELLQRPLQGRPRVGLASESAALRAFRGASAGSVPVGPEPGPFRAPRLQLEYLTLLNGWPSSSATLTASAASRT